VKNLTALKNVRRAKTVPKIRMEKKFVFVFLLHVPLQNVKTVIRVYVLKLTERLSVSALMVPTINLIVESVQGSIVLEENVLLKIKNLNAYVMMKMTVRPKLSFQIVNVL
jgi:hypothetical protein